LFDTANIQLYFEPTKFFGNYFSKNLSLLFSKFVLTIVSKIILGIQEDFDLDNPGQQFHCDCPVDLRDDEETSWVRVCINHSVVETRRGRPRHQSITLELPSLLHKHEP